MRTSLGLAATVVLAAAVCFASPAHADDFRGTYIRTLLGDQSTWSVTSCGAGCAHVTDSSGWSADAHPFNGQWTFSIDLPDATKCNNDGRAPGTVLYSVNPARLAGTVVTSNTAPCALAPGYSTPIYFTLTKVA